MKILLVIGTRPEAIKMAPLIKKFKENSQFIIKVCNTGQHKDLMQPVLDFFKLEIDFDLDIMMSNQGLHGISSLILNKIKLVYDDFMPDYVIVHGDTTTSFIASLAAFYSKIKVAHVEAGLRTFDLCSPFPEEMNRTLTAKIANIHFAPTITAKKNLEFENINNNVIVTGNTVIDALFESLDLIDESKIGIIDLKNKIDFRKKIILVTAHRRENFGAGFEAIFGSINEITKIREDVLFIYPVHPNPNVKNMAESFFSENKSVLLVSPLEYDLFIWLLMKSYIILSDSGGVQEEAPSLGKPVLVLRDTTERPEAVEAGTVILVGSNPAKIKEKILLLLNDQEEYERMTKLQNPYGDGKASERIVNYFMNLI